MAQKATQVKSWLMAKSNPRVHLSWASPIRQLIPQPRPTHLVASKWVNSTKFVFKYTRDLFSIVILNNFNRMALQRHMPRLRRRRRRSERPPDKRPLKKLPPPPHLLLLHQPIQQNRLILMSLRKLSKIRLLTRTNFTVHFLNPKYIWSRKSKFETDFF